MNRRLGQLLAAFLTLVAGIAEGWPAWKWTLQNGFDGSEILSMATDGSLLLAATKTRGVYRSHDSGRTWHPPDTGTLRLHFIEFDSASQRFYGLGDYTLYAADSSAREWTPLTDLTPDPDRIPPEIYSTARFSVHGRVIILLNFQSGGVKVSRDGGSTWRTTLFPTVGIDIKSVLAADSCAYASNSEGPVNVSCDGGATWRDAGGDTTTRHGNGLARHQGSVLVTTPWGIFSSGNAGRTWTPRNGNLLENIGPGGISGLKSKGGSIYALKWEPMQNLDQETLHRSRDGGSSWTAMSSSAPSMEVAELGMRLFQSSIRGVLRSPDDGVTWSRVSGLGDAEIITLAVQGRRTLALTGKGVFVTADSGATWDAGLRNDATATWTTLSDGLGLYAVLSKEGGVRVSSDSGATWKSIPVPAQGPAYRLAVLGRNLYLVTVGGLWRSGPDGSAWTEIPLPATDTINVMAGGTRSLLLCGRQHVWEYREDGGFINRNGSLPSFDIPRAWLIGEDAYVVSQYQLHAWETASGDWRRIGGYNGYPYSMTGRGSRLLMGTGGGSHQISLDGGRSWEEGPVKPPSFPQGGSTSLPLAFTFALDGNQIFSGDGYGGIWRLDPDFLDETTATRGLPRRASPGRGPSGIHPLLEAWKVRLDGRAY